MLAVHEVARNQAKDAAFNKLCDRPGTAYVDCDGRTKAMSDHGKTYTSNHEETFVFSNEDSRSDPQGWNGAVTVAYDIGFNVE
ncbi:hypothetical protein BGZ97_008023, partial [Linnemannia gamsii]